MDKRTTAIVGYRNGAASLARAAGVVGLLLLGAVGPTQAQRLQPGRNTAVSASAPATTDGCIGAPLMECVARIKKVYALAQDTIEGTIEQNKRVDVNGNPVVKDPKLMLFGKFRSGPQAYQGIILSYGPNLVVHRIAVSLASDPQRAQTQDDYERTGLANAVVLAVGHECPDATNPMAIYRFFQNRIKSQLVAGGRDVGAGMSEGHDLYRTSMQPIPFCGHGISYSSVVGNTTDAITDDNPDGSLAASDIIITD